jgi:hypothetical protein
MSKSYQVVESPLLDGYMTTSLQCEIVVAILHWLIKEIKSSLAEQLEHVELDVIRITYLGSYPAIGICYRDASRGDVGPLVESSISQLLNEKQVINFIKSLTDHRITWSDLIANQD